MNRPPVHRQGRLLPWRRIFLFSDPFSRSRRLAPIDVAAPRAVGASLLFDADIPFSLQLVERAFDGRDAELEIACHAFVADVAEFVFALPVEEIAVNGNGLGGNLVHVNHFERSHKPPFCAISRASLNVYPLRCLCSVFPSERSSAGCPNLTLIDSL